LGNFRSRVVPFCTDWRKERLQRIEKLGPYRFEMQFDPPRLSNPPIQKGFGDLSLANSHPLAIHNNPQLMELKENNIPNVCCQLGVSGWQITNKSR